MQSYTEIPSSQSLQSSLALLLNNDKTTLSCSSGSAFPNTNLQVGMLCFRTDQLKLYILKDATPTWMMLLDLNTTGGTAAGAAEAVYSMFIRNSGGANEGGEFRMQKAASGSTLVGDVTVDLYQNKLRFFDSGGTAPGFYIDISAGTAGSAAKIWHENNDGAGSGLDADLLDGMASGNASGNIPISNGTLNTNLNADMVDGKHVGNGTGQIPLSNGTVNTDLNADTLDGYHASSFVRTIQGVAPDASGNVVVDLASKVSKSGDTMTGDLTVTNGAGAIILDKTGDLKVYRSGGTTGVLYLNSAGSRYIFFDGTNYNMPGANLLVNGGTVWHTGNIGTPLNAVNTTLSSSGSGNISTYGLYRSGNTVGLAIYYSNCNCTCTCSCFPAGTKVLLADGTWTDIESISVGDMVIDSSGFGTTVIGLWRPKLDDRKLYSVDDVLKVTGDHLFKTPGGWAAIEPALYNERRADSIIKVDGLGDIAAGAIKDPAALSVGALAVRHGSFPRPVKVIEQVAAKPSLQLYTLVTKSGSFVVEGGFVVDGIPQGE
jgi:hypothetical protein